jgi:hypothetical protein
MKKTSKNSANTSTVAVNTKIISDTVPPAQYEKHARSDNFLDTLIGDKLGCQGRFISGRRASETMRSAAQRFACGAARSAMLSHFVLYAA